VERELTPAGAPEEVLIPRAMPPAIIERAAGAPFFRLFHVAATGNLTLDGLTLAGGNIVGEGGGLRNRGRTVVMHSTLTDNAADYGGGSATRARSPSPIAPSSTAVRMPAPAS
jgi:hypothetical protein